MGILTQILGLLLSLTILVFVHELGHYIFARIFGVRVDKFYLFFNPSFSILRMKKYDGKFHFSFFSKSSPEEWAEHPEHTEWGIGWVPLGGYCSINGMVDETTKPGDLPAEPQDYEFRAKAAWKRFFIIIGGVLMNFITALVLYVAVFYTWGEEYVPLSKAPYGLQFTEVAKNVGFQDGDQFVSVDGKTYNHLADFLNSLLMDNIDHVVVNRGGEEVSVAIPKDFGNQILASGKGKFADFNFPFVIAEVAQDSPAQKAGLQSKDSIIGINGVSYTSYFEFQNILKENAGQPALIAFYRDGEMKEDTVVVSEEGKLGVYSQNPYTYLPVEKEEYTFLESIPRGVSNGVQTLGNYVKQFKLVASKEGIQQIGGFGTIGSIFPKTWDWHSFWAMTAFLSIILAFMNILPIPALDGGYLLFILVEMISGRKPSDKFIGYANAVGLSLLLLLLVYANGMDIVRAFFR